MVGESICLLTCEPQIREQHYLPWLFVRIELMAGTHGVLGVSTAEPEDAPTPTQC